MLLKFFKQIFYFHRWEYRNPYNRTCKVCGKHEVEHYRYSPKFSFWEVWDDGNVDKHIS